MAERERRLHAPVRGRFCCPDPGHETPTTCSRASWRMAPRDHRAQPRPRRRRARRAPDRRHRRWPPAWPMALEQIEGDDARRSAPSTSPSTATTSACGRSCPRRSPTSPVDLDGATVVLVDDVLFTGRTIRGALDALADYGRARAVAAGRDGRPGPPGAADPPRLRGQEPADPARRGGRRRPRRRRPRGDGQVSRAPMPGAPALHRRPRPSTGLEQPRCDLTDTFVEVSERRSPRCPPCGASTVVSLFFEDSTRTRLSLRDGGQAALGRHHDLQRRARRR